MVPPPSTGSSSEHGSESQNGEVSEQVAHLRLVLQHQFESFGEAAQKPISHGEFLLVLSFAQIEHRRWQCDVNLLLSLCLASETLVLCSNRYVGF